MGSQTVFTALPFSRSKEGRFFAGEAKVCTCAEAAALEAERFKEVFVGAIAFSRTVDIETGACAPAHIIKSVGDVPRLAYLNGFS